jgi:epoxyqueuosine reductase QueG
MADKFKQKLKEKAFYLGADLFGVADLKKFDSKNSPLLPENILTNFKYGISIAIALPKAVFMKIEKAPTPEYAKVYNTVNNKLDEISLFLSKFIEKLGFKALPIPASQILDKINFRGAITHKAIARLSGIGWQGKSLLIISPEYGPRIRIATILTNMELEPDKPLENRCGNCNICKEICPSQAIKGNMPEKEYYKNREEALFFNRCKEKLMNEFAKIENVGYPICGFCIKVCPYSKIEENSTLQ